MRLKSKECIIIGQTRPFEMRPNKTNFGLSFGDFRRAKREGEKGREEEEEEEEQRYGIYVWITMYL